MTKYGCFRCLLAMVLLNSGTSCYLAVVGPSNSSIKDVTIDPGYQCYTHMHIPLLEEGIVDTKVKLVVKDVDFGIYQTGNRLQVQRLGQSEALVGWLPNEALVGWNVNLKVECCESSKYVLADDNGQCPSGFQTVTDKTECQSASVGITTPQFIGCYKDDRNRDLDVKKAHSNRLTIEQCNTLCSGYRYFSMQNSNECRCGDKYGRSSSASNPYTEAPEADCGTDRLGGPWRNAIFLQGGTLVSGRKLEGFYEENCYPNWPPSQTCFIYTEDNKASFSGNGNCATSTPAYSSYKVLCSSISGGFTTGSFGKGNSSTCRPGQGQSFASFGYGTSADNSQSKCEALCFSTPGCTNFDFTENSKWDSCRLYKANIPQSNPGGDSREYCTMPSITTTTTTKYQWEPCPHGQVAVPNGGHSHTTTWWCEDAVYNNTCYSECQHSQGNVWGCGPEYDSQMRNNGTVYKVHNRNWFFWHPDPDEMNDNDEDLCLVTREACWSGCFAEGTNTSTAAWKNCYACNAGRVACPSKSCDSRRLEAVADIHI